jgi:hypothetical protein
MFTSRKRKAATYHVAAMLIREELHKRQGEQAITVEQMDRESLLGITIPDVVRNTRFAAEWDRESVEPMVGEGQ